MRVQCQAKFTQAGSLRRHAEVCIRGVSRVVCRGERIQSPETAYEKALFGKRTYGGKAVSWMENESRRRGVHINHQMCGHDGERVIAGYPVDGFPHFTRHNFHRI